jgi:hypothetical protein
MDLNESSGGQRLHLKTIPHFFTATIPPSQRKDSARVIVEGAPAIQVILENRSASVHDV